MMVEYWRRVGQLEMVKELELESESELELAPLCWCWVAQLM